MNTPTIDKSLSNRREFLCQDLQQNRRLMAHQIRTKEASFPRSIAMRFLSQKKSSDRKPIVYWSLVGISLFRNVAQAIYIASLLKRKVLKRDNGGQHKTHS